MALTLHVDCLLRHATLITMDESHRILESGAIAILGEKIVDIGLDDEISRRFRSDEEIDCRGGFIIPGLINLHGHAPMILFRGTSSSNKMPAPTTHMAPELLEVPSEMSLLGFELAAAEMIRSGITTIVDMYHYSTDYGDLVNRIGMRAVLGEIASDLTLHASKQGDDRTMKALERHLSQFETHPRIRPAVAPHSVHTLSRDLLMRVIGLAREASVPILTHAGESEFEMAFVNKLTNSRPIRLLDEAKALGPRTIVAHAVHADREDIARLAHHGASVAHCPQANLARGVGICPVEALISAGVNVGLGTDDADAHGALDILSEIKVANLLQGLRQGASVLNFQDYVSMATKHSSRALGHQELGVLKVDTPADLVLLDTHEAPLTGLSEPHEALVRQSSRGDVRSVMVGGRWLMRDRDLLTIDESSLIEQARQHRSKATLGPKGQGVLLTP